MFNNLAVNDFVIWTATDGTKKQATVEAIHPDYITIRECNVVCGIQHDITQKELDNGTQKLEKFNKAFRSVLQLDVDDLREHIGEQMEIAGEIYELDLALSMSGELVRWGSDSENYVIYATPDFEGLDIALEVLKTNEDGDLDTIGCDSYNREIIEFDEYKKVVKEMAEKIIKGQK